MQGRANHAGAETVQGWERAGQKTGKALAAPEEKCGRGERPCPDGGPEWVPQGRSLPDCHVARRRIRTAQKAGRLARRRIAGLEENRPT